MSSRPRAHPVPSSDWPGCTAYLRPDVYLTKTCNSPSQHRADLHAQACIGQYATAARVGKSLLAAHLPSLAHGVQTSSQSTAAARGRRFLSVQANDPVVLPSQAH